MDPMTRYYVVTDANGQYSTALAARSAHHAAEVWAERQFAAMDYPSEMLAVVLSPGASMERFTVTVETVPHFRAMLAGKRQ